MAAPTSSYLQTLPQDDAIAFIASLQTVKGHLSRELQWMQQQVQQKTVQLQGIETLLTEAASLGFPVDSSPSHLPPLKDVLPPTPNVGSPDDNPLAPSVSDSNSTLSFNGNGVSTQGMATPDTTATISTTAALKPKQNRKNQTTPATKSKPQKPPAKTSVTNLPKTAAKSSPKNSPTSQKPKPLSKSAPSKSPSNRPEMRELLLPKFGDKTLKEATTQVLQDANKPLHLNEIITEMYGSLSKADLNRAKVSLMNVLSAGRKDGIWRNLGQGKYAATGAPS